MKKRNMAAFTLTEGLLTLGLFLLALAVLSSLLGDFSSFYKRFFRGDTEVAQAPEILQSISTDIWESRRIVAPTASANGSIITLNMIDPTELIQRLDRVAPAPPQDLWDTGRVASFQLQWELVAGTGMMRRSAQGQSTLVGRELVSFAAQRTGDRELDIIELSLVVKDGNKRVSWTRRAVKRLVW